MAELHLSSSDDETEKNVSNKDTFDFTKKTWKDDVAFVIEGERLYASKSVLALVSQVFESMFGSQFAEKFQNEVPLPGKKYDEFHEFLRCIYPTSQMLVSELNVTRLLPLADEYQVKSLIKRCNNFLSAYILAKEVLPTPYLMKCHQMSTRYQLSDVKERCVSILAERGMDELNRTKCVLHDQESFIQLQSDIIKKQESDREERDTELVKIFMNVDMRNNFAMNIRNLEYAKGVIIDLKAPMEALLQNQPQYSVPVRVWDLYFQLHVALHVKHDGEQGLKFKLYCTFPNDGIAWVFEAKIKLIVKNQSTLPTATNLSHTLARTFFTRDGDHAVGFQTLAPIIKKDSGYVSKDKLQILVYFLANKPHEDYTRQSSFT